MEKKEIFCVSYASFFDNELYTETLAVFPTPEEAQSFLSKEYENVLRDDFEGQDEDELNISRYDSEFSIDNDYNYVVAKVERKTI